MTHRNFIRFNLSEYSHVSKFNRLTGGDPNYVGYKVTLTLTLTRTRTRTPTATVTLTLTLSLTLALTLT